jgi:hypothetical protein
LGGRGGLGGHAGEWHAGAMVTSRRRVLAPG